VSVRGPAGPGRTPFDLRTTHRTRSHVHQHGWRDGTSGLRPRSTARDESPRQQMGSQWANGVAAVPVSKRTVNAHGFASRTPWQEASRELPSAWLKDEGLASWKDARGVPSNIMIELRRWLREDYPELIKTALPPARPQRAQARLEGIWARAGEIAERHPTWRPVEGLLRLARDQRGPARATPDGDQPCQQEH
jgi:hypothetical protein